MPNPIPHRPPSVPLPCRILVLSLTWLIALPDPASTQERRILPDRAAEGRVAAELVQTLSFADLERAPNVLAQVVPLPAGGWGVSSPVFGGVIQRFDSEGTAVGTFGRPGEGPGEFGGHVLAAREGTEEERLWVLDPANARLSVFDSDLSLVGDRLLPGRPHLLAPRASGPGVILTGFLNDADGTHPVGLLTLDGNADVFGGEIASPNPRVSFKGAAETEEGVWTIANSGGTVNLLDADDLSVRERWRLPGDEMAVEAPRRMPPDARPVPQLAGVTADRETLWVTFAVADAEWSPDVDPRADGPAAMLDTRVFAVDPAERAVVGVLRLDAICFPVDVNRISCVDEIAQVIRILELERVASHLSGRSSRRSPGYSQDS